MRTCSSARCVSVVAALLVFARADAGEGRAACAYGIVTDATRSEYAIRTDLMDVMKASGIGAMRVDWDWRVCQPTKGARFDFSKYERLVSEAEARGQVILPIMYGTPEWASPVWEHLEEYEQFVRETVAHFGKRMPVIEIWNEQNECGFWFQQAPSPENYMKTLRAAWKGAKSVDPEIRVAFGGTAGWAHGYIKECYQLGLSDVCDILCVHPYTHPYPPESSWERNLKELRDTMKAHGDGDKPLWFTEIGWPTHDVDVSGKGNLVEAGLRVALPTNRPWRVIYAGTVPDVPQSDGAMSETLASHLPDGSEVRVCGPKETCRLLGEGGWDAVIYPSDESYPADTFEAVVDFVAHGGTLVDLGGMPFWNAYRNLPSGRSDVTPGPGSWKKYERLHVGCDSWWIKGSQLPKGSRLKVYATDAGRTAGVLQEPTGFICGHFFTAGALKGNDRMIPLIKGTNPNNGQDAVAACVYVFDSDLKGRCVISGISGGGSSFANDERQQAALCARSLGLAFALGVESYYYYNLRSREHKRFYSEDHFGLTHANLVPKPGLAAYDNFTKQRPQGSRNLSDAWKRGDCYCPQWKRPDGSVGGMVWNPTWAKQTVELTFESAAVACVDLFGKPLACKLSGTRLKLVLNGEPVYFQGSRLVSVEASTML